MSSTWKNRAAFAVLGVALFTWGCDSSTEPTGQPSGVQAVESTSSSLLGELVGTVEGTLETGLKLVQTTVTVVGDLGTALIGPVGGLLEVNDHDLSVPPGAVPHPTLFSMEIVEGRTVVVDLRAVDPETGADVGGKGFKVPVTLALSYDDLKLNRRQIDDLVIVRIHDDGTYERLPSVVNKDTKQVSAKLDHFSRYGLCSN